MSRRSAEADAERRVIPAGADAGYTLAHRVRPDVLVGIRERGEQPTVSGQVTAEQDLGEPRARAG